MYRIAENLAGETLQIVNYIVFGEKTLTNLYKPTHSDFQVLCTSNRQIKVGEFVASRQIHQIFLPPKISAMRYTLDFSC